MSYQGIETTMNDSYEKIEAGEFPAGMKVLVVDNDEQSWTLQQNVLSELKYDVHSCAQGKDALKLLREKKGSFDLVLVDVNIPDMDCFTLLKHIKEEMNLPTIMMLGRDGDGDGISSIMRGIADGACDFLIKPMTKEHVKNIWHHAARNKHTGKMELEGGGLKRPRFVWTEDRKRKFENAVNQMGIGKATPSAILRAMNDSEITRTNVASHLQKYRLNVQKRKRNQDPRRPIDPDGRTRSPRLPHFPNQLLGRPIIRPSAQYDMQRSRSHFPRGQTMVFDGLRISQITRPIYTTMNMHPHSTQPRADFDVPCSRPWTTGSHIPSTGYASPLPGWFANFIPPRIPGGGANNIRHRSGVQPSGNPGGNAHGAGLVGGRTDWRHRRVENSSVVETSTESSHASS